MPALGLRSPSMVPLMGLVPVRALSSAAGSRLISHRSAATVDRLRPDIYSEDEMARVRETIKRLRAEADQIRIESKKKYAEGLKMIEMTDQVMATAEASYNEAARRTRCGSVAPICNPKGLSSQQDDGSQGVKVIPSLDDLLEDICRRIHARMPLRDAARLGCASHTFWRSWRCYPNLDLRQKTLVDGELKCEKWTGDDRAKSEE
ncbi:hypothetical protein ZWY2020_045634 [Hordeum vulgare]|nr:hypothetical protein ZWY2020_045634 [Hordeum vulgare]